MNVWLNDYFDCIDDCFYATDSISIISMHELSLYSKAINP